MLQALYHIARNTFRECIRQPIYAILLLTAMAIIGMQPGFALYVFRQETKLVSDGALAAMLLFGMITAVLCASYAVAREIETGTILLVLSKPVNRGTFLVAKVLGILAALALFVWVTGIGTLWALRIATDQFRIDWGVLWLLYGAMVLSCVYGAFANYTRRASFPAATVKAMAVIYGVLAVVLYFGPVHDYGNYRWGEFAGYDWNMLRAILLVFLAVLLMGALATALSTWLDMVSNLAVCTALFLLGLLSNFFYTQLVALKRVEIEQLMHHWFFLLIPLLLGAWFLAAKHWPRRRNEKITKLELHLAGAVLTLLLVLRAGQNIVQKVGLREPNTVMLWVAGWLFRLKNVAAELLHAVLPNWQLFWRADALAQGNTIPFVYIAWGAVYMVVFITALTTVALAVFNFREVGEQSAR